MAAPGPGVAMVIVAVLVPAIAEEIDGVAGGFAW